jgi:hypothetical protein
MSATDTATTIAETLELIHPEGNVFEIRILDAGRARTVSGYFDDVEKAAQAIGKYDGKVPGIFVTANPVKPDLLSRAENKLKEFAKVTTDDPGVLVRRWLPVDIDPKRESGISSTDRERDAALALAKKVRAHLTNEGWPGGLLVMSGNGAHLWYRIQMPNDDASRDLIKRTLEALDAKFTTDKVEVDTSVFNAARIMKVPGTMVCKGDNTDDRPHRRAELLDRPSRLTVVSAAQLMALAGPTPPPPPPPPRSTPTSGNGHHDLDLNDFLRVNALAIRKEKVDSSGVTYELEVCPFCADHVGKAWVKQLNNGAKAAGCVDTHCTWNWQDLRARYDTAYADRQTRQDSPRQPAAPGADEVPADATPYLLVPFSEIDAEPVEWVWPRWIPAGMPTILFGLTGMGKSHIYVDIAARVSTGAEWPDGGRAPQGNVVILSAEDGAKSVIKPRLVYAGADCSRVFHFPSVAKFDERGKRVFNLITDLEMLKANIERVEDVALAILDPITAYLSGVDSHVVSEVRAALALVDEVAQSTGVAILCVMHPNKNMTGDMKAIQRLSGSGAFGDAPRCVMLAAEDSDRKDEKRNLLLPAKMNLGLWPEGIGYRITASGPLTCESRATWDHDPVTVKADDLLKTKKAASPSIDTAMDFLRKALADNEWHPSSDLIDEAGLKGISESTLRRAADQLEIAQRRVGFPATGEWCLEVF